MAGKRVENLQKALFIREFTEKRAGVLMITCLKTRKSYLGHSDDVEWLLWHIKRRLYNDSWRIGEMQEDWNRYGAQWFRFGVAFDTLMFEGEETETRREVLNAWIERRPSDEYTYNKRVPRGRIIAFCKDIEKLGKTNINVRPDRKNPVTSTGLRGIFILTCTKNKRQLVGYTENFDQTLRVLDSKLARSRHGNPALQGDFNRYGRAAFTIEFCEVKTEVLLPLRNQVIERLQSEYNRLAEQARNERRVATHTHKKQGKDESNGRTRQHQSDYRSILERAPSGVGGLC